MNETQYRNSGAYRVAFYTLGCRLNQYDTEVMKTRLPSHLELEVVAWEDEADVYIINSCTVTLKADQKCRQMARQVKRRRPEAKVVVTGCYAQTQPEALAKMDELDGIIGNTEREDIHDWLPRLLEQEDRVYEVSQFSKRLEFRSHAITEFEGRTRAYVKIQDGCDLRCTYCLIWKARGPGRSRSPEDILAQIAVLRDAGYREIVLTGVHMGSYGRDLRWKPSLTGLVGDIATAYPEMRFRLSSIHPNEVRDSLLGLFTEHSNIRRYLHVSMQSASDPILDRMHRPYSAADVTSAVRATAALDPHFGIGADVIVGFPGETDEEFETTRRAIENLPLSYLHVFRYSPRPGTKAAEAKPVHTETVTARSAVLRELSLHKKQEFETRLVGATLEATVETDRPRLGRVQATTGNYATVLVPDHFRTGALVRLVPDAVIDGVLTSDRVELIDDPYEGTQRP